MAQQAHTFEVQVTKIVRLNYLLYLPKGYGADPQKKWPLIFFLHGAGERGDDLELVKVHGIPKILKRRKAFPFIVVSPQCSEDAWWPGEVEALAALLDDVVARYAVDPERVYLTGLSMGGFGAWSLAMARPERFAAVVPICGGGNPKRVCVLQDVPVWAFHGALDPVVPLARSEEMVNALKECGGDVRLTVYPDAEHDSWTRTYDDPELYAWFLRHTRKTCTT